MREEPTDGNTGESVKQYMFVPADELPPDLDNTMDTTAADESLNVSQSVSQDSEDKAVEPSASGKLSAVHKIQLFVY